MTHRFDDLESAIERNDVRAVADQPKGASLDLVEGLIDRAER